MGYIFGFSFMLNKLKSLITGSPAPKSKPPGSQRPAAKDVADAADPRLSHAMPGEFERVFAREEADPQSWIGVDLDGTLSRENGQLDLQTIGDPIPEMVARVEDWIAHGYAVKVLTARASVPEGIPPIKAWLKKHGLPDLEVTDAKDLHMIELWDDRAVQIIANQGQPVGRSILEPREEDTPEQDDDTAKDQDSTSRE